MVVRRLLLAADAASGASAPSRASCLHACRRRVGGGSGGGRRRRDLSRRHPWAVQLDRFCWRMDRHSGLWNRTTGRTRDVHAVIVPEALHRVYALDAYILLLYQRNAC